MHSPLSSCKNLPPYFFMVHLLHRLYGVDAPGEWYVCVEQRVFCRKTSGDDDDHARRRVECRKTGTSVLLA